MRRTAVWLFLLAGCGGSAAPSFNGHWREQVSLPGTGYELTLNGKGTTIAGRGVLHREAGMDAPFQVTGSSTPMPGHGVTFEYGGGATESFSFSQPDAAHLELQDAQGAKHDFFRM